MKDYYKILGIKDDASEEEIRARWIELTKHYHPDRGEELASDEKIREINEAYQVLKHSSTRVEYDLKRTYGQKKGEEKRGSYFKRLGIPAGILIIVIIIGLIYLRTSQNGMNHIDQKQEVNRETQTDHTNQINQKDQINQKNQRSEINQMDATTQKQTDTISSRIPKNPTINDIDVPKDQRIPESTSRQIDKSTQKTKRPIGVITPQPQLAKVTPGLPGINPTAPKDSKEQKASTTQAPKGAIAPTIIKIPTAPTIQKSPTNLIHPKIEQVQLKPPSLLAPEDEVKKFFNNYIKHYNRKDVEGFLSLFSSKAIQNEKDGLEEIRKIYTDFFNQGQEARYSLQGMKIEMYQNAVEVRARYEIEQIVKGSGEREVWGGPIRWVLIKEDGALKIFSIDYKDEQPPLGKKEEANETS